MRPPTLELVPPKNSIQEQLFKLINEIKGLILWGKELIILGGTLMGGYYMLSPWFAVYSLARKNNKPDTEYVHSIPIN